MDVMKRTTLDRDERPNSADDVAAAFAEAFRAADWTEEKSKARGQIEGQLVVWGYVQAYRECGGIGYPAGLNGAGSNATSYGLPDLGTAYCTIEKELKGTAPVVRGILHFQFVKPHLNFADAKKEQDRNIQQLADTPEQAVALVEEQGSEQTTDGLFSMKLSVEQFVDYAYGQDLPEGTRKSLYAAMRTIRKRWMDSVVAGMLKAAK